MVSGFVHSNRVDAASYDACEAARFTMYISETLRAYPCSFMESAREGIRLTKNNMSEVWQNSALFLDVRKRLRNPTCGNCSHVELCRGGCPVFSEINLCAPQYNESQPR